MKKFVVHISDAHGIDAQSAIAVDDSLDLGRAAQIALDELVNEYGSKIAFPIFVDIHPQGEFESRKWMHQPEEHKRHKTAHK
jgi:hypothetical protein